jgi:AcrR family transcriptional regulator
MPRISEDRKEARRAQLLDAARAQLAEHGYRDLSVDEICGAAELSKGSFYGYFESKQAMLLALLDDEMSRLEESLAEISSRPASKGETHLREFTRGVLREAGDPSRVQLRADLWALAATDETVRERLFEAVARRRELLRVTLDRMLERDDLKLPRELANAVASILLALGDGLVLHSALDPTAFRWANVRRALDLLLAGAEPDDAS